VDIADRLASHVGQSLAACCRSSTAAMLGGYRFLENKKVDPEAISQSAFAAVAAEAYQRIDILAIEDTTMLYLHSVAGGLGAVGRSSQPRQRGYLVHSVLLVDAKEEETISFSKYLLRHFPPESP